MVIEAFQMLCLAASPTGCPGQAHPTRFRRCRGWSADDALGGLGGRAALGATRAGLSTRCMAPATSSGRFFGSGALRRATTCAEKGNTPGACHEGISDTGELVSRIRSIIVEFHHQVEQAISTPRLSTYRNRASSDEHAWALYRWNIDLAAAVAPLAADLEVTQRTPTASGRERRPIRSEVYRRAALFQRLRNRAASSGPPLRSQRYSRSTATPAGAMKATRQLAKP